MSQLDERPIDPSLLGGEFPRGNSKPTETQGAAQDDRPIDPSILAMEPPPPEPPSLETTLGWGANQDPDAYAKALQSSLETGLPTDVVLRNQPEVDAEVKRLKMRIGELPYRSPFLAKFMENPDHAAVGHDSLEGLGDLEALLGIWAPMPNGMAGAFPVVPGLVQRGLEAGAAQRWLSEVNYNAGKQRIDPETMPGYGDLVDQSRGPDMTGRSYLAGAVVGHAQILPGMILGWGKAALAAASAEAGAAALGAPTGPGAAVTAIGGIPIAYSAGLAARGKDTYNQETGNAYAHAIQKQKEQGLTPNYDVAWEYAKRAGLGNAALEVGGDIILGGIFKGTKGLLLKTVGVTTAKDAAVKALASPAGPVKNAITSVFKGLLGTTEEATIEGLQRSHEEAQTEQGVAQAGGHAPDFSHLPADFWDEFKPAFQSMLFFGGAGAVSEFVDGYDLYRQSVADKKRMNDLGKIIQEVRLQKRMPEKIGEFAGEMVKAGAAPEMVYVSPEDFNTFWQDQGLDPREVAKELGVDATHEAATVSKSDIAIPFETYVEKISDKTYHKGFSDVVKFDPDGFTPKQAEEFRKNAPAQAEKAAAEMEQEVASVLAGATEDTIGDRVTAQLLKAGYSVADAQANAAPWVAIFRTAKSKFGVDLGAEYQAIIQREGAMAPGTGERRFTQAEPVSPEQLAAEQATREGGYVFTPAGEIQRKGKPPIRYFISNKDMPGGTGKAGSKISEDLIRSHGLDPDAGTQPSTRLSQDQERDPNSPFFIPDWRDQFADAVDQIQPVNMAGIQKRATEQLKGNLAEPGWMQRGPDRRAVPRKTIPLSEMTDEQQRMEAAYQAVRRENRKLDPTLVKIIQEMKQRGETTTAIEDTIIQFGGTPVDYGPLYETGALDTLPEQPVDRRKTLYQAQGPTKAGYISFEPGGRQFKIGLLDGADLSTFLHESGHFFLEFFGDIAGRADAPQSVKDDYAAALKYLGVGSRDEITTEHHEKWARTFEAFLMEGKAPTAELAGAFTRYRNWLVSLYRRIRFNALYNVQLTDEVRGVMDRLLATDDEIAAASSKLAAAPMFTSMDAAGMTLAQWEKYRDTANAAVDEARQEHQDRMLAEVRREKSALWKEERDKVMAAVTAEVNNDPAHQANEWFKNGVMLSPAFDPHEMRDENGAPRKLKKSYVRSLYSAPGESDAVIAKLGKAAAAEGIDPEVAAPFFGFKSGAELVDAMTTVGDRKRAIRTKVREELANRDPEKLVVDAATVALHSTDALLRQYEAEYNALSRKAGKAGRALPSAVLKDQARQVIQRTTIRQLNAGNFSRAEATANRQAREMERKGDFEGARTEVQRAILNYHLYRAAVAARVEVEAAQKFLTRSNGDATRARLGKAGEIYRDQQDKLLERFEFRDTLKAADRREALLNWVNSEIAAGRHPEIADRILDEAHRTHWKNLSVEELEGLRDAVKNIQHLAGLKTKLLAGNGEAQAEAVREELTTSAEGNLKERPLPEDRNQIATKDAIVAWFADKDADLLRIETMINWLDGDDPSGPWHRYILDVVQDAKIKELDLAYAMNDAFQKIVDTMPKEIASHLNDQVTLPGIGQRSRKWLMALGMNVGNDGNYGGLLLGHKWDPATLDGAIAKLKPEEMDYVQGVWDLLETLKPEAAALYTRRTGLPFPEVKAREVTITHEDGTTKTYRGGYFPIKYDRLQSVAGESQIAETVNQFFETNYVKAATSREYSKERVENVAHPFDLRLTVLPNHISQVIHDIAFGEAVASVGTILLDPDIRRTMQTRLGEQRAQAFLPWLKGVANYQAYAVSDAMTGFDKTAEFLRANTTAAVLAAKITIATGNIANLGVATALVNPIYLTKGLAMSLRNPARAWREVKALSGEMRHRMGLWDRDVREQLEDINARQFGFHAGKVARTLGVAGKVPGLSKLKADAMRFGYAFTATTDIATSVPIWYGAYEQQLAKSGDHDLSVRFAGSVIRRVVGSSHPVDLPAIMRKRGMTRALTMFYGYSSAQYQLLRSGLNAVEKARLDGAVGKRLPFIIAKGTAVVLANAILGEWLSSRGPDDDEDKRAWALRRALLYGFSTIPVVRDFARGFEGYMEGFDNFSLSPLAGTAEKAFRALTSVSKAVEGEKDPGDAAWSVVDAGALVLGVPGYGQARTTEKYFWDLWTGDEEFESWPQFLHDAAYPRRREKR